MGADAVFASGIVAIAAAYTPCSAFVLRTPASATTLNIHCSTVRGTVSSSTSPIAHTGRLSRNVVSTSGGRRGGIFRMMSGGTPEAKDIFDALTAGDDAGVNEYVDAGGDCSVRDAIGGLVYRLPHLSYLGARNQYPGDTPLMLAVESEMTMAVAKLAKEGGADVNQGSETTGETPLQLAAYYGYTHLARVLVGQCGADMEIRNKKGDTALGLASYWGNTETVKYLVEAGANPDVANEAGERPGDAFDTVFVPEDVADGGGGENGDTRREDPRTVIVDLLNEARAARKLASI